MQKFIRSEKPIWYKKRKNDNKKLIEELLKITNNHCAYTDKKIDKSIAEIDNFKPKSKFPELYDKWDNLFVVEPYINRLKSDKYDAKIIKPDEEDYEFDKYFEIDFENFFILPNQNANKKNIERAETTIDYIGLNNNYLVDERANEFIKFYSIYYTLKEIAESKTKEFNIKDYPELDLNNFSFRFMLEKAINHLTIEKNEYINKIEIDKFYCIKNAEIELNNCKEVYFLGENGDGKTVVLQSILSTVRGVNDKNLKKYFLSNLNNNFSVKIFDEKNNKYILNSASSAFSKNIFAYGASRLLKHTQDSDNSGFLSLFEDNTFLRDPIIWLEKIRGLENKTAISLKNSIKIIESLYENKVKIIERHNGQFIFLENGTEVTFEQLSHGYRSTLIWLCDLISRLIENQPKIKDIKKFKGTVLVDEIGTFLHPKWEYTFVRNLRETFKNIQWIFTTHSPIIILGASKDAVIYKLYKKDGITFVSEPIQTENIIQMTLNSLITSMLWRLPSCSNKDITTQQISDDDYPYKLIHDKLEKEIAENPNLIENDLWNLIEQELSNIKPVVKNEKDK